jgi:uncharacterized protein (DUF362 family)
MPLTRRGFLAGALAAGALPRILHAGEPAASPPDLVVARGTDFPRLVAAALAPLGGLAAFVTRGAKVTLKPNWSFANPPEWGSTTSPELVVAVAQACLDAGAASVQVLEYPLARLDRVLERTGANAAMARIPGAALVLLGKAADFTSVAVPGGAALEKISVARAVLDADVNINLPQAKSHGAAMVSFGLKNAMGLVADRGAFHHAGLSKAVVDLARVYRPTLTILDATRALVTGGPGGPGDTELPGCIVAGRDVVAVDAYGLGLARFQKRALTVAEVPHIDLAGKAGLGVTDLGQLGIAEIEV